MLHESQSNERDQSFSELRHSGPRSMAKGQSDEFDPDMQGGNSGYGKQHGFTEHTHKASKRGRKGSKTPVLDTFGTDLTDRALNGELDPVIGREAETERMLGILMRRTKNNPVLIGEAGVGKTAVVEGLAQVLASDDCPPGMENKRIVEIDLTGLVAGTQYRGQFEERLKGLVKELESNPDIIAFIDEIHMMAGAGSSEGGINAGNVLKPALARGAISLIGATTLDEYRKHIENDAALERRFQSVMVNEPKTNDAIAIIEGLIPKYAEFHGVQVDPGVAEQAVKLSQRYIPDRFLPDKAIDLLDEACSKVKVDNETGERREISLQIKELEEELDALNEEKQQYVMAQSFDEVEEIANSEYAIEQEIKALQAELQDIPEPRVGIDDVARAAAMASGVPVDRMTESDKERVAGIKAFLKTQVIGQDHVVDRVGSCVMRSSAGLADPNRPNGVFAFFGPTGVGKTELSKALARFLFDNEDAMVRVDMSEFMEPHSVAKLVGAPPGYVGYEEGGQLTEQVRRKPYSVILLDEIEKAHPKVFDILLQMFEEGRLTDGLGRNIDFSNTYIIMTSNAGADAFNSSGFGFAKPDPVSNFESQRQEVLKEAERYFRPELVNRIDEMAVFKPLDKEAIRSILDIELDKFAARAQGSPHGLRLSFDQSVKDFLMEKGFNPQYGARPLRRAIGEYLEDPLSEGILAGEFTNRAIIKASYDGEKIVFSHKPVIKLTVSEVLQRGGGGSSQAGNEKDLAQGQGAGGAPF